MMLTLQERIRRLGSSPYGRDYRELMVWAREAEGLLKEVSAVALAEPCNVPGGVSRTDPALLERIAAARTWFDALTPEQQEEHLKAQRDSWVRGEMAFGSDADEAAYRASQPDNVPAGVSCGRGR